MRAAAVLALGLVAACSETAGGPHIVSGEDSGAPSDVTVNRADASNAVDAGSGDVSAPDSAGPVDSGFGRDVSSPDASSPSDAGAAVDGGVAPRNSGCDTPFPSAQTVMKVGPNDADRLPGIVSNAPSGTTILLEDGTYRMTGQNESRRRLVFSADGVTLRGASEDASSVIIDGEYTTNEMIFIRASNITIADLTIMRAVDHLVHVTTNGAGITGTRLHRIIFEDSGEQFVKVNSGGVGYADEGEVSCSQFILTDDGRPNIERNPGGCYTGGIDAHSARDWHVHHNHFEGIYCAGEGLAEHAVHFWRQSRDTLVENNIIVNCARGIGFGLTQGGTPRRTYADQAMGYVGHYGGLIRNNVVFADIDFYDTGIELNQARDARVYFNTVVSNQGAGWFTSVSYRFANTDADIRNNILRGIRERNGASARASSNLVDTRAVDLLVDPAGGDFHLRASSAAAIDSGEMVADPGLDIDGEPRTAGAGPDLGADER